MAALGRLFGSAASKGGGKAAAGKSAGGFGAKAKKFATSTFGQTALATVGVGILMSMFTGSGSGSSSGTGSSTSFMA